jgi:hypothetical protein
MKMLLAGIAAAILAAVVIGAFLPVDPKLAWQAFTSTNVRVGDPGSNLVGPDWTGEAPSPRG